MLKISSGARSSPNSAVAARNGASRSGASSSASRVQIPGETDPPVPELRQMGDRQPDGGVVVEQNPAQPVAVEAAVHRDHAVAGIAETVDPLRLPVGVQQQQPVDPPFAQPGLARTCGRARLLRFSTRIS